MNSIFGFSPEEIGGLDAACEQVGADSTAIAGKIAAHIWKVLRDLDVMPVKLHQVHREIVSLIFRTYDQRPHKCNCSLTLIMQKGCQCQGE